MRVKTTDLQNAFGKYLALVEKEDIIITKNGRSVAKLSRYTEPDHLLLREGAASYKAPKRISYEEYTALVETSDRRYELIDGEIHLMASPSYNHQIVSSEIAGILYNYFKGKPCRPLAAPLDVHLFGYATKFEEDPNVVQPDLVVICDTDKVNADNKYEGVPTLIVEVLSPSTKGRDLVIKLNLYMKSGVVEYWLVDPEDRNIIQYSFSPEREVQKMRIYHDGDKIQSTAFTGLEVSLADVFSRV